MTRYLSEASTVSDASSWEPAPKTVRRLAHVAVCCFSLVASTLPVLGERAGAAPTDPADPLLPVVAPGPSNWTPKFPFPYDANRKDVTDADITAEREMCQWFKPQYRELDRQIDRLGFNLLEASNDWTAGQIQAQADSVAANIDRTEGYLAPRAQALKQVADSAGDVHFAIYEGEAFYRLWQHLSNVGVGIKARNTAWVNGPSVARVKHWGSQIHRSHVCD